MYIPRSLDSVQSDTYVPLNFAISAFGTNVCGQRLSVDKAREVIVKPVDEPVHLRRDEFCRTPNRVDQDQYLRGFLRRDTFEDRRLSAVRGPDLFCGVPSSLSAAKDQRQALGDESQPLAFVELAQAVGLAEPDLGAFRLLSPGVHDSASTVRVVWL
jgi:hypothetical protein